MPGNQMGRRKQLCRCELVVDERTGRVIMMGALDNLVKRSSRSGGSEYEFIIWIKGIGRSRTGTDVPVNRREYGRSYIYIKNNERRRF